VDELQIFINEQSTVLLKIEGGNLDEFSKLNAIRQYFTQPNLSPFFLKLSTSV